jgi:very-short-patch-repair endonuclease
MTKLITSDFFLPYNPELKERARELRKNMTPAERKLWRECLRDFPFPVLRQRPIDYFIVDFYCPKLKLVIEVDGESHFVGNGEAYDDRRTKILNSHGLKVLRFTNREVMASLEVVYKTIMALAEDKGNIPNKKYLFEEE